MRIWVRKRRWWWTATNPEHSMGPYYRARTRERAVEKCRVAMTPKGPYPYPWEEVDA